MRLTRAAACRSLAGCLLALTLTGPALAHSRAATVLDLAGQQKNLSTFVAAVHAAGLDDTLKAAGPITVYAPTDEAFAKLPAADRDALLHDPARLKALLLGLTVNDLILMRNSDTAVTSGTAPTAGGGSLTFGMDGDRQTVAGAHVVSRDLRADNGCITTLDQVPLT
jgi:uncharacterized surface protein with fasciclin (FAS1) repeats